ncbi:peptide deformylase [Candidatus Trichorickettsia mobilis]|uniref:peptide deformylase n=1 Tax=Candidatus Trichorickettsia mobilis TaxID=1346319 RepID=UPI003742A936
MSKMVEYLNLVYAPNDIFRQKAAIITIIDDNIRTLADQMLTTMYTERAIGLGANMVGVLKRIAVVDLQENGIRTPYILVNPEINWRSTDTQTFNESSLSFPGIAAEITRPKAIQMTYLDYHGIPQTLEAEGLLATVIQHEIDYLDGKIFLDYLSKMKQDLLLKKMIKYLKLNPPHIHGAHCHHH